jgi:DNA mismatch repair ATPase MutS
MFFGNVLLMGIFSGDTFLVVRMRVKEMYPSHLVLVRIGDFFEAYNDDALALSDITGIAMYQIKRWQPGAEGPLFRIAGFPYQFVETCTNMLVKAGVRFILVEPQKGEGDAEDSMVCSD